MTWHSQAFHVVLAVFLLSWAMTASLWASPDAQTFDITIRDGRVSSELYVIRVKQGDRVRLRLVADESMDLHLHGYDIQKKATPGAVIEFVFEAFATGRFPVNVHVGGGDAQGTSTEFTLLYVEVHPR
jgi:hypothetical protein